MKSKAMIIILSFVFLLIGFIGGLGYNIFYHNAPQSDVFVSGELEFHFMELGNGHTGDSFYIRCGTVDILVDGGSETNRADTIENYVKDNS